MNMIKKNIFPKISKGEYKKTWREKFGKNRKKTIEEIPFKTEVSYFLGANLFMIALSLAIFKLLPPEIPLFYGLPTGSSQIASKWLLSTPSVVSILIIIVNIGFARIVKSEFLKKTLIFSAMFITVLSIITTLKIIFLIASI